LHIENALRDCRYPDWTFQKVKKQMKMKPSKRKQKRDSANRRLVVLPYVEGTSERIARVMRKHQVPVAVRPVKTLNHYWCIQRINKRSRKLQIAYTKFHVQIVRNVI